MIISYCNRQPHHNLECIGSLIQKEEEHADEDNYLQYENKRRVRKTYLCSHNLFTDLLYTFLLFIVLAISRLPGRSVRQGKAWSWLEAQSRCPQSLQKVLMHGQMHRK